MPSRKELLALYGAKSSKKAIKYTNSRSESEFKLFKQRLKQESEEKADENGPTLVKLSDREKALLGLDSTEETKESHTMTKTAVKTAFEKQLKYEWGTGTSDRAFQRTKKEELAKIAKTSFSQYEDNKEVNQILKSKIRKGDPMAHMFSSEAQEESDEETTVRKYRGPQGPPNRFDIQPGYRWDGVDRSNGFERNYLKRRATEEATKKQRHLNAVANF